MYINMMVVKRGNMCFFILKALHKSFTTNYAFKDEIRDTGAYKTPGRSMYINWMDVKSRKQTFIHINSIALKFYHKLCI